MPSQTVRMLELPFAFTTGKGFLTAEPQNLGRMNTVSQKLRQKKTFYDQLSPFCKQSDLLCVRSMLFLLRK